MSSLRNNASRFNGAKQAKTQRTDSAFEKERDRIRAANDEKTKRLRGLRLAKEAADREALEKAAAAKAEQAALKASKAGP